MENDIDKTFNALRRSEVHIVLEDMGWYNNIVTDHIFNETIIKHGWTVKEFTDKLFSNKENF